MVEDWGDSSELLYLLSPQEVKNIPENTFDISCEELGRSTDGTRRMAKFSSADISPNKITKIPNTIKVILFLPR